MRTCTVCGESKPISEFRGTGGKDNRPRSTCKPCQNAYTAEYRRDPVFDPSQELERMRRKVQPTPDETKAVDLATNAIEAFQESKGAQCSGYRRYDGRTAWEIIEEATDNPRRFHQLCTMATLLHATKEEERTGGRKTPGQPLTAEVKAKVIEMAKRKRYTRTYIALACGIEPSTVYRILSQAEAA